MHGECIDIKWKTGCNVHGYSSNYWETKRHKGLIHPLSLWKLRDRETKRKAQVMQHTESCPPVKSPLGNAHYPLTIYTFQMVFSLPAWSFPFPKVWMNDTTTNRVKTQFKTLKSNLKSGIPLIKDHNWALSWCITITQKGPLPLYSKMIQLISYHE